MKPLSWFFIASALAGALSIVGCSGDNDDSSGSGAPSATATTQPSASPTSATGGAAATPSGGSSVSIVDFGYSPVSLSGRAGQELTLAVRNAGQAPHTFTITGLVDSGTLEPGQSREVKFTPAQAGTLVYFCMVHGQAAMSGQLVVSAGAVGQQTNPSGGAAASGPSSAPAGPAPDAGQSTDYGY